MNIEEESKNCVCETLKFINKLQKKALSEQGRFDCAKLQCRKNACNTRPIMLFQNNGNLFQIPIDNVESELASVFRVEDIKGCCATLRILRTIPSNDDISDSDSSIGPTNQFVTINTECFCAVKCLDDIDLNSNILIEGFTLFKDGVIVDSGNFIGGVHFFEAFDLNNDDTNPTYRMDIRLADLSGVFGLSLVNEVTVNNPNFVINDVNINHAVTPNVLSITFTVMNDLTSINRRANFLAALEQTQEVGLFEFSVVNADGIVVNMAFLVTIVNVYP